MITIEIQGKDVAIQKKRVKKLISLLPKNAYYHFLFEPELIIRLKNKHKRFITDYLKTKKIAYRTYPYPFPKKGFGEDKRSVMYKYQDEFKDILYMGSRLSLKHKKRDTLQIIERYNHTFLNALGYDWISEAVIYQWLAGGRISVVKKYDRLSPIAFLLCILIIQQAKLSMFLMKLLK